MSEFTKVAILFLSGMIALISVILGEVEQYLYACLLLSVFVILLFVFSLWFHYRKLGFLDVFSPMFLLPLAYIGFLTFSILLLRLNIGWAKRSQFTQRDMWYHLIGLFCFVCGIIFGTSFKSIKKKHFLGKVINKWHPKTFFNRSTIIFIIGLIGVLVYYSQTMIPWSGDVDEIRHGVRVRLYGIGFSIYLLHGLNLIFISYLLYSIKEKCKFHAAYFLSYVVFITFISLGCGYRWPALIFFLSSLVMCHYIVKKLNVMSLRCLLTITLTALVGFSLLGFLGYLREKSKEGGEDRFLRKIEYLNIPYKYKYIASAVDSIQTRFVDYTRLTKIVPEEYDFFYGRYTLSTIPVLNRIFPGLSKEKNVEYVSSRMFQSDYPRALTACGIFYIDFGLGGILVGFFLLGLFIEKCYLRMFRNWDILSVAIYSYILLISFMWIISGIYLGNLVAVAMALVIDKLIRTRIKVKFSPTTLNQ